MNQYIVWDVNFLSNVEEFAERSIEMTVILLVDFYSEYNQVELHQKSHDMIAFQTLLRLLWQIKLSMRAMNSVNQFWQIVCWMLKKNHDNDKTYFDDIQINESKIKYNDEKILSSIWWYMFEHFQHIDCILVSIKLAEAKIAEEKSYWC